MEQLGGSFYKWLHSGFILKVRPTIHTVQVNVGSERKRETKDGFRIFGLSSWKNHVNAILSELIEMEKNVGPAG